VPRCPDGRSPPSRLPLSLPPQIAEALEAEQEGHSETRRRLDAARARVSSLQREAGKLREGVRTLVGKSDVDDKLVAALRAERLALQQSLSEARRGVAEGGSPARTVFTAGASRAAFSVGSPGGVSDAGLGAGGDAGRLAAEGERVSRLAQGQARRLEAQAKLVRDLRSQLRDAKEAAAAAAAAGGAGAAGGGGRAIATGDGERPRPESGTGVRAMAALEVRAAEAGRVSEEALSEAAEAKASLGRAEERCRQLEKQVDQYVSKFSALERRCRHLEARVGGTPPATDAVSLAAQLATSENERRALRSNMASAIAARDAELVRLRERLEGRA